MELIPTIEELAANAWPAPVQQQLERWRLRAGNNVTRRANSVLAVGAMPVYEGWLNEVAAFYRSRALPMRFHVSDASPAGLEEMLDGLGYKADAHSSVQVAPCDVVRDLSARPREFEMVGFDGLDGNWLDSFLDAEGMAESKKTTYAAIFSGIGPRRRFVQARLDGQPVGVGMAVAERGWAGLFAIATASAYRGRGIGTQVVNELADWSHQNGASGLYLQVMFDNKVAIELYGRLGFAQLYRYHYRVLD